MFFFSSKKIRKVATIRALGPQAPPLFGHPWAERGQRLACIKMVKLYPCSCFDRQWKTRFCRNAAKAPPGTRLDCPFEIPGPRTISRAWSGRAVKRARPSVAVGRIVRFHFPLFLAPVVFFVLQTKRESFEVWSSEGPCQEGPWRRPLPIKCLFWRSVRSFSGPWRNWAMRRRLCSFGK